MMSSAAIEPSQSPFAQPQELGPDHRRLVGCRLSDLAKETVKCLGFVGREKRRECEAMDTA